MGAECNGHLANAGPSASREHDQRTEQSGQFEMEVSEFIISARYFSDKARERSRDLGDIFSRRVLKLGSVICNSSIKVYHKGT